jgi:hypothetical protein
MVRQSLRQSGLPFDINDPETSLTTRGIEINAVAHRGVSIFDVNVRFSVTVVPQARPDGTIGVELLDVRVAGGSVPDVFWAAIQANIDRALNEQARLQDFRVTSVEVSPEELFVYLDYDG